MQAQRQRSDQIPVLQALANDPMQVMIENGLPADFLDKALPDVKSGFLAYLKTAAANELKIVRARQAPRGFFRCWACRIGPGVAMALVGLALSAVTVGAGGAIFVAAVNFMVTWGVAMVTAEGAMIAATAAGGVSLAGGISALIEFVCEKIPDTC